MEASVESAFQSLEHWAHQDSENRAIVCIAFEKTGKTQDEHNTQVSANVMNLCHGQQMNLILAFTTALQQNNAELAKVALAAVKMIQMKSFKSHKQ